MAALRPVVCVLLLFSGRAGAAISIQDFTPATNDRFANDPSFIGAGFDWSGVGRSADGKWAVMISPNVFLSATHHHPATGGTLTFFSGNDPGGAAITGTIAGAQQIGGTDLWIGHLSSGLPGSVANYGFMTVPLDESGFGSSWVANAPVFLSGLSPTVGAYGASPLTNHAVGSNRLEGFFDALTVSGSTGDVLLTVENLNGDAGYAWTSFEADVNSGDSGSPLMVVDGSNLVLAGIAWASGTVDIDPGPDAATRNASVFTYTGNQATAIQGYLTLHAVPEPSALLLLSGAAVLFSTRRRRPPSAAPMRPPR